MINSTEPQVPERLLSAAQTAELLGLSRNTVYALMQRGELRHIIVGRRRLVERSAIADFVLAHST